MTRLRFVAFFLGMLLIILLKNDARALYDPGVGRFCSRDPIGYAETSWNLTEFLNSKSLDKVDHSGNVAEITVKRFKRTFLEPHCDLPVAWATFNFELSEWPCRGNIGYFVQKVSVACNSEPCDRSLVMKDDDGRSITSEDFNYFEAWKVSKPLTNMKQKVIVQDKAKFAPLVKGRGRYRQDGRVKFYCLSPDGTPGFGEVTEAETSSPGANSFGKLCKTSSVTLDATQHDQPYFSRPAAAESASRTFGMNWNCCCGKPLNYANAFARPD